MDGSITEEQFLSDDEEEQIWTHNFENDGLSVHDKEKMEPTNVFDESISSNECKDVVCLLTKAGMKPSEITKIVNAFRGNEDDKLSRVQCSNIVSNERKYNLGKECHGIIMHFQEKAETDQDFYFAMDLSKDGTLKSVFWADGRSRSSYHQFGDVVIFDTTYRTNKFSFPFALFVGVNHQSFCLETRLQYDKAISSRRRAEADQDFRIINSKNTLHGDHPIEAMTSSECYTRNIYEVSRKSGKLALILAMKN
ncbi:FAR1-related sequence 5-like protein [Tanacetum coccineum]